MAGFDQLTYREDMALQLKPQIQKRIEAQLAAGHYGSVDDLVTEALDVLESYKQAVAADSIGVMPRAPAVKSRRWTRKMPLAG